MLMPAWVRYVYELLRWPAAACLGEGCMAGTVPGYRHPQPPAGCEVWGRAVALRGSLAAAAEYQQGQWGMN